MENIVDNGFAFARIKPANINVEKGDAESPYTNFANLDY